MSNDADVGPVLRDIEEIQSSLARSNKILAKWKFPQNDDGLQTIADFRNAARKYMKLRINARARGCATFAKEFSVAKQELLEQEKLLQTK